MLVKCVLGWVNAPPALFSLAVHPDLTVFVCIYVRLRTDSGLSNVCRLLVIPVSLFPAMTESPSVFLEVSHSYQHIYSLRGIKQPLCVYTHTHTHTLIQSAAVYVTSHEMWSVLGCLSLRCFAERGGQRL